MGSDKKQGQASDILSGLKRTVEELGRIHIELLELNKAVERLELSADEQRLDEAKGMLRDVYVRISQAGSFLVDAHVIIEKITLPSKNQ